MGRKRQTPGQDAEPPLAACTNSGNVSASVGPLAAPPPPPPPLPGALPNAALGMLADPSMAIVFAANPGLAAQLSQQALRHSMQQSAVSTPAPIPEVQDLAEHYGLDERITKRLDDELRKRMDSLDSDVAALWDILETARNPAGLLAVKIQEMQDGVFAGKTKPDKDLAEIVKKFKLDESAATKLAGVLMGRKESRKTDLEQLNRRLETSNKPSAMVMMLLPKLRSGEAVGEPDRGPAPGSYLDLKDQKAKLLKEETAEKNKDRCSDRRKKDKSRSRSRSSKGRKKRSRSSKRKDQKKKSKSRKRRRRSKS